MACDARPPLEAPPGCFYTRLVQELDELGWQHVHWLCCHLSAVHLRISDAAGATWNCAATCAGVTLS